MLETTQGLNTTDLVMSMVKEGMGVVQGVGIRTVILIKCWILQILPYLLNPYFLYREVWKRTPKIKGVLDRSGHVAVLTGGTRGIGLEVLKGLLKARFHVVLGARSPANAEAIVSSVRQEVGSGGSVRIYPLDLKSLRSVKKFASHVKKNEGRVDLLINNGGIMFTPHELTEDGYESAFQVNYLSHFLLTLELLPLIKETARKSGSSGDCRIVNVSSDANYGGDISTKDFPNLEKGLTHFVPGKAYPDSKLCQVMHAKYLNDSVMAASEGVYVYSLHPGIIPSDLWEHVPLYSLMKDRINKLFRTPQDGADTILYCALSPELIKKGGGHYVNSGEITEPNSQVKDKEVLKQLWERSMELCHHVQG